jgi:hypothetical protein
MHPLTATPAKPPEDIDAVLGRFQAWSATRKIPQKAAPKKSHDLPEGVRELSYEEALESSRDRWQVRTQPSASDESKEEIQFRAKEKPAPATTQDKPTPVAFNAEAIQPDKLSLTSALTQVRTTAPPDQSVAPAFGAVLAEALPVESDPNPDLGPLALIWPASPKNERQVSMTLRVAASEQALIKARAAEAGLSVSAYLRQCALEVEKLRAQVHHTLALIEQKSEQRPEPRPTRSLSVGSPTAPPPPRRVLRPRRPATLRKPGPAHSARLKSTPEMPYR